MALKRKISKKDFQKLPEALQEHYKEDGDDYVLDAEGGDTGEDVGALKRARDREKQRAREAEEKLRELETKLEEDDENDARKRGDLERLEKKWEGDLKAANEKSAKATAALRSQITKDRSDSIATSMAAQISNNPKVLSRFIKDRLSIEFDDDNNATTVILDKDGKPSSATIEDLQKEMVANPDFKDMILAHKGSGGAKPDDKSTGGGATYKPVDHKDTPDLTKLSAKDMAARIAAKKEAEAAAEEE